MTPCKAKPPHFSLRLSFLFMGLSVAFSFTLSMSLSLANGKPSPNVQIKRIDWRKQWYPVAIVADLDPNLVHSATILGNEFVYWKNSNDKWSFAEDLCPHRLAALSEGYLDDQKRVVCRYHGWAFEGNGKCSCIPMAEDGSSIDPLKSSIATFPATTAQGILWMWPDSSDKSKHESAATPLPLSKEFDSVDPENPLWVLNDFPVDYEAMVENSFDPSHAMFLHKGAFGYDPVNAVPMSNFSRKGDIAIEGFNLTHNGYSKSNKEMDAVRSFQAPIGNYVEYIYPNKMVSQTQLYFTPILPGFTRAIVGFQFSGLPKPLQLILSLKNITYILPLWLRRGLSHAVAPKIVHEDTLIMHDQKLKLQSMEKRGRGWQKAYFLPTKSDVGVVNFRRWFDKFSGGKVGWASLESYDASPLEDAVLYERWNQHTKNCASCLKTVNFLTQFLKIVFWAKIICAVALIRSLAKPKLQHQHVFISAALTVITFLFHNKVKNFRRSFFLAQHPFREQTIGFEPMKIMEE